MRTTPKMLINRLMQDLPFAHLDTTSGKIVLDSGMLESRHIVLFVKKLLLEKFAAVEHGLRELREGLPVEKQAEIDELLEKVKRTKYIH